MSALISNALGTVNSGLVAQLNSNLAPLLAGQLGVTVGGADVFALRAAQLQRPAARRLTRTELRRAGAPAGRPAAAGRS